MGKRILGILAAVLAVWAGGMGVFAQENGAQTPPSLYAQGAILLDADTGQVLYQKNAHQKLYPASITKIMTCLIAMEEGDPADVVTITDEGVQAIPRNTTHIALTGGEQLTLEQLEYAMMVQSANDAANAIAIHLAGSVEAFVQRMNQEAARLGAENTHFTNPHGLPDPAHYTTAYDMGLITREALTYPEFRSLAGTQSYEIPPTNLQKDTRYLANNQYMFTLNDTYPGAFAGKTGWTEEAGHTLVTIAEQNGVTLICIVLHSDATGVLDCQYKDSTALLDYGFQNFSPVSLPAESFAPVQASFLGENGQPVEGTLQLGEDLQLLLPQGITLEDVELTGQLPQQFNEENLSQAAVQVQLTRTVGSMDPLVGSFPLEFQQVQTAVTPVEQPEEPSVLFTVLKWALAILAVLAAGLLVLRQVLLARYRKRKRLRDRQRILSAPPPQRPRPRVDRVIDVTVQKNPRNHIRILPPDNR